MFGIKKPAIDVIKYEGPNDVFIWKADQEDFNTKTQLLVHESQEAVFFRNGQALDLFPAGRYTLETQNLPFLSRLLNLASGGITPFHSEVYFINKAVSMGMPWGTDAPIEMLDPEYGIPIKITAYGDFSLRVKDSRKLLVKLVGTVDSYTQEDIQTYFTALMAMHIRNCIAASLEQNNIGGMRVNTQLIKISKSLHPMLVDVYKEYGLELCHISVSSLKVRGLEELTDTMARVKINTLAESGKASIERMRINVDAERIQAKGAAENAVLLEQGIAEARINQAKGITEAQKLAMSVAADLAKNPGPNVAVGGAGMVGGFPIGGAVAVPQSPAGLSSEIVKSAIGNATNTNQKSRKERLKELKEWYEEELITAEEYENKKKAILEDL